MAIKPILFNTEMVQAILRGQKTQTRRVINPQPQARLCYAFAGSAGMPGTWGYPSRTAYQSWGDEYRLPMILKNPDRRWTPPCKADDVLWVRETWGVHDQVQNDWRYKASDEIDDPEWKWRPSIHMPRDAARIFLKVKNVKVQRLREMTECDAYSEGCRDEYDRGDLLAFSRLWDSTLDWSEIPSKGWHANPWVWVIEFEPMPDVHTLGELNTAMHGGQEVSR